MNTISLCMIVKNEESNIRKCLDSVLSIVDEIIVVDTGSTDNTLKICSEYAAHIYTCDWENDFSKVRNISINHATSNWILWMDADEILEVEPPEDFKKKLDETIDFYSIKLLHHMGHSNTLAEFYQSYHPRLFHHTGRFKFVGSIHERLEPIDHTLQPSIQINPYLSILHSGYEPTSIVQKAQRNLSLLLEERVISSNLSWIDYHIAVELYQLGANQHALMMVNQSITEFLIKELLPPALLYKLKYEILIHTHSLENAYDGIVRAIKLYPDYVDLHYNRGLILIHQENFDEAINAFSYCLILGEANPNYLIHIGYGSFHAATQLAYCYEKLGKNNAAEKAKNLSNLFLEQAPKD